MSASIFNIRPSDISDNYQAGPALKSDYALFAWIIDVKPPLERSDALTMSDGISPKGGFMLQQDGVPADGSSQRMKELIQGLAIALVDIPESVSVEVVAEQNSTVLRLRVAPSDIGKVIGKQGRTARSIRTILSAASMKQQHRFSLDILEDVGESQEAEAS